MLPFPASAQQPTVAADTFVDSVGVNVHLHYFGTAYDRFPALRSRLIELGVRHVRDGLIDTEWPDYYSRHNSLAQAGIKTTFVVSPDQSRELWASYPTRMGRAFEAYEAPNELDKFGDANWVETLRETVIRLGTVRSDPRAAPFPVIGPSLSYAESYAKVGDLSAHFDIGNIHNYMGGRHPGTPGWAHGGYGSIGWNLNLARPYTGGKPIITTENGYYDGSGTFAVPQDVAGRYMPRLLLAQYQAGIPRTYIYELADWSGSGNYGLLNHDLSPKPAFTAVKSLLNLLSDPGPAFPVQHLGYNVQGGSEELRHLVFQKRDGTYYLAIWLEASSYDNNAKQYLTVAPQSVTVTTATPMRVTRMHRWQHDGSVSTSTGVITTATFPLDVSDAVTVIELAPPASAPQPPSPPPGPPAPPPLGGSLPGAPSLMAAVYDRNVHLRWQPTADGSAPEGYVIEASASLDFSNLVRVTVGPVTELTVPNVLPGLYLVRIRAINAVGESGPSNVETLAVGAPPPPQLVPVQVSTNPIVLTWSAAQGVRHHFLSAGTSPGASDVAIVSMGTATQVTAQVPHGVRYYVSVSAVNDYGATRSNEVSVAVDPPQLPGAPALNVQVSGRRVSLSWAPGQGGAPANYVLAVGGSSRAWNIGTFNMGLATQIAADSPISGQFFVRVYAQNAGGAAWSNEVSFTIP